MEKQLLNKKQKAVPWHILIGAFCMLCSLFLVGIVIGKEVANSTNNETVGFLAYFLVIGITLSGLQLLFIFHELGHALMGKLTGYQAVNIGISNWQWYKKDTRWHFTKKASVVGAGAQYVGKKKEGNQQSAIWLLLGGIFVHILFILIFGILALLSDNWLRLVVYLAIVLLNTGLLLFNAVPHDINDGAKIKEIKQHKKREALLNEQLMVSALQREEKELGSVSLTNVALEQGSIIETQYLMLLSQRLLKKEDEDVIPLLEEYIAFTQIKSIAFSAKLMLLRAYIHLGRTEQAQTLFEDKLFAKLLLSYKHHEAHLIQSMYYVYIKKDLKKGKEWLIKTKKILSPNMEFSDDYANIVEEVTQLETVIKMGETHDIPR